MRIKDVVSESKKDSSKGGLSSSYTKTASFVHPFYLFGIEGPEVYADWFDTIRNASENDIIKIHINSPGGDLLTAIQFIRVLQETQATVICSVEGQCCSAATLIFLQADLIDISDHSLFMFHNYSGGTFGKGGEMLDQLKHETSWAEKLFRDIYKDFLTQEEINSMLNNKDIWMDGEEVLKRLKEKVEKNTEKPEEEKKQKRTRKPRKAKTTDQK